MPTQEARARREPWSCPARSAAWQLRSCSRSHPLQTLGLSSFLGGSALLGCVGNCGLLGVSGFHARCPLCPHLCVPSAPRAPEDAWWDLAPVSRTDYFSRNHKLLSVIALRINVPGVPDMYRILNYSRKIRLVKLVLPTGLILLLYSLFTLHGTCKAHIFCVLCSP